MYKVKISLYGLFHWTKASFNSVSDAVKFAQGLKWNWVVTDSNGQIVESGKAKK